MYFLPSKKDPVTKAENTTKIRSQVNVNKFWLMLTTSSRKSTYSRVICSRFWSISVSIFATGNQHLSRCKFL